MTLFDDTKSAAQRRAELSERHSDRLLALGVATARLKESNDKLEAWLSAEEEKKRWQPRKR